MSSAIRVATAITPAKLGSIDRSEERIVSTMGTSLLVAFITVDGVVVEVTSAMVKPHRTASVEIYLV